MADILTYGQIEGYWIAAGGDPKVASTMAAIALAESSGQADIKQPGQPYSTTGWGLWQITPGNSEPQYGTDTQLFDPLANAKAAVAKYNSQGLHAWTTYTTGIYKRFLTVAPPVAPKGATGSTGSTGGAKAPAPSGQNTGLLGGILGFPGEIVDFFGEALKSLTSTFNFFAAFFRVSTYIRIAAGLFGLGFLITGFIYLGREARKY